LKEIVMINGPVEYIVISFPGNHFSGEIIPAIADVVEKGVVRIIDLVFIRKDEDGSVTLVEFEELDDAFGVAIEPLVEMVTGLVAEEDIEMFGEAMEANHSALAVVFEHLWAAELGTAVRRANGRVIADGHIPREAVMEILEMYGESA